MTIHEFAGLSGISRDNLIYYDRAGLIRPASRAANGYRLYTYEQLSLAHLVSSLRALGVPVAEIRSQLSGADLGDAREMLARRAAEATRQIEALQRAKHLLETRVSDIDRYAGAETPSIRVEELPAVRVAMGPPVAELEEPVPTMTDFLVLCRRQGVECTWPVGRYFTRESFLSGPWVDADRIFLERPDGAWETEAGSCLVGLFRVGGEGLPACYEAMRDRAGELGLVVRGGAYEDYPLMGLTAPGAREHLVRITVPVALP